MPGSREGGVPLPELSLPIWDNYKSPIWEDLGRPSLAFVMCWTQTASGGNKDVDRGHQEHSGSQKPQRVFALRVLCREDVFLKSERRR
jgi:hypothetical protein